MKKIELSELSPADLAALMANLSRRMSSLPDKTDPKATALWEDLAFKRSCLASEFNRRVDAINFPQPKKKNDEQ